MYIDDLRGNCILRKIIAAHLSADFCKRELWMKKMVGPVAKIDAKLTKGEVAIHSKHQKHSATQKDTK